MTKRFDWVPLLVAFVLLCVANGRWQLPLAAWLAPIFLLIFIQSQPVRRGLGLAFLAQLLAFFVNWRGMIPVPGAWYYVVAGVYAAVYFAPFVLHRAVASRLAGFRSTLVFPTAWVGVELLFQNLVTPYGSWASLSYTQVDFLPLIQLASLTGSSGIHFVMTWSAAVAARAWEARASLSRVRTPHRSQQRAPPGAVGLGAVAHRFGADGSPDTPSNRPDAVREAGRGAPGSVESHCGIVGTRRVVDRGSA